MHTNEQRIKLASLLIDIENELRHLLLWQDVPPPADALQSQQPFCIDTLTFSQWIQFIFLPTMHELLNHQRALPSQCEIAPMAEEYFRGQSLSSKKLIIMLSNIDQLLGSYT